MKGLGAILALLIIQTWCQEDSLRSALDAFDRRQEEFPERFEDSEYGYPLERPEDVAFIKAAAQYRNDDNSLLEKALDYLEDQEQDQDDVKKRIYSSFRERMEEDKEKQMEDSQNQIGNSESDDLYNNLNEEEYEEFLRKLWERYRRYKQPFMYLNNAKAKRYYYPQFGIGESVGLRKRSRYYNTGNDPSLYMLNHSPRDDLYNRLQDEDNEGPYRTHRDRKWNKLTPYGYSLNKRFPVTKRSSDYLQKDTGELGTDKSESKKETDPKVAKELSNVFGVKTPDAPSSTAKPTKTLKKEHSQHDTKQKKKQKKEKDLKTERPEETKEVASPPANNEKPLQIKKKSIDWSDYFGLDRRKKSDNMDKEWLWERYHKAVSMASKRSPDLPLQSFKNHDAPDTKENTDEKIPTEDDRINEMDAKLKTMEDTIVDDALKFTGAHEGAVDTKEVQAVKNMVIPRLAAAYNLEKMRNALGEYKIAKERQRGNGKDTTFQEEKRTSVPRKQAVDERAKTQESDNSIKCVDGNTDECLAQTYGLSTELLERHFGQDQCPIIEIACNEVAMILGRHIFEKACNMYEMCLICTNNIGMSTIHHCNGLFLSKANELCRNDDNCKRDAKNSLSFLLDVNRSLQADSTTQDQCETHCPNMETLSELFDLR